MAKARRISISGRSFGAPPPEHGESPRTTRGDSRISNIGQVARQAGVSVGTVSNVLNRPEIVAPGTRDRVLAAIEQLKFVRNGSARSLRSGRSRSLGLVVLDVTNPFFTEVARGVEDAASAVAHAVVLCNSDGSLAKERQYLRVLEEQRAAGLLITPVGREPDYLEWLRQRGMAVVLLDRASPRGDFCSVAVDDVLGGALAARHLLALGHRRLGVVTGPTSIPQCESRLEGLRRAVEAVGMDPETDVVVFEVPALNAGAGEAAVTRLLAADPRPTAVFCANDVLALGVLRGLGTSGARVPEDFALVGYDDVEFAAVLSTPLTTVRQPKQKLGFAAARLLLDEMELPEGHTHEQVLFRPDLIVRASSGAPTGQRQTS